MVATGTTTVAFLGFVFPALNAWPIQAQGLVIVAVILVSALVAVLRFRVTQNVVNVVFVLYGLAILAMFAAGVVYLARGHHAAVNPWDFTAWRPGSAHGLNFTNWTFFGLAVLALLGVEVPLNMGVEIREQKSVTRYLLWGSLVVVVAYLLATWGVMVTVPASSATNITAVPAAAGDVAREQGPGAGYRRLGADRGGGGVHAGCLRRGAERGRRRRCGQRRDEDLRRAAGGGHGHLVHLDRGAVRGHPDHPAPLPGPVPGPQACAPGGVLGLLDHRRPRLSGRDHRHSVRVVDPADREQRREADHLRRGDQLRCLVLVGRRDHAGLARRGLPPLRDRPQERVGRGLRRHQGSRRRLARSRCPGRGGVLTSMIAEDPRHMPLAVCLLHLPKHAQGERCLVP